MYITRYNILMYTQKSLPSVSRVGALPDGSVMAETGRKRRGEIEKGKQT